MRFSRDWNHKYLGEFRWKLYCQCLCRLFILSAQHLIIHTQPYSFMCAVESEMLPKMSSLIFWISCSAWLASLLFASYTISMLVISQRDYWENHWIQEPGFTEQIELSFVAAALHFVFERKLHEMFFYTNHLRIADWPWGSRTESGGMWQKELHFVSGFNVKRLSASAQTLFTCCVRPTWLNL